MTLTFWRGKIVYAVKLCFSRDNFTIVGLNVTIVSIIYYDFLQLVL